MTNDLTKKASVELDGFAGYTDETAGGSGDDRVSNNVILGSRIKFLDAKWITTEGVVLPPDLELVVINIRRIVNKWGKDTDKGPLESRELAPGEPYPDFKELNEKVPRKEWVRGPDGQPRGPYQGQRVVYFLDLDKTMSRYTWIDQLTVGGSIAMSELVDQTRLMRKFRQANVVPKVRLSNIYMHTRYGGRQRPHLPVADWIILDGGPPSLVGPGGDGQLPPAGKKSTPLEQSAKTIEVEAVKATRVEKPSAKEVTGDEIKY